MGCGCKQCSIRMFNCHLFDTYTDLSIQTMSKMISIYFTAYLIKSNVNNLKRLLLICQKGKECLGTGLLLELATVSIMIISVNVMYEVCEHLTAVSIFQARSVAY